MGDAKCPPPPTLDQKFEKIKSALDGLGGDQKCKNTFANAVDNKLVKVDAAVAAIVFPFGAGGAATSVTNSAQKLNSQLSKEGCADIFANINQQMESSQSILCELNNNKSVTTLTGSANATIALTQLTPTTEQVELRKASLENVIRPVQPVLPQYVPGETLALYKEVMKGYNLAMDSYNKLAIISKEQIDNILGKITINRSSFTIKASVDMKALTNTNNVSLTKLAEEYKKVAKSQALSDLKQNTGYGANSDTLKSLVASKISNKNQNITDSIKNNLQSIKLVATSSTTFALQFYGPLELNDVIIDEYAQTRLIASNIMSNASNMGKSIALDIMQESATTTKSEQTSTGQEKLMAGMLKGQLELSKANAEGASKLFGQVTSFMSFGLIGMVLIGLVALMFVPNLLPGKSSGIIGIIVSVILIYLVAAWFLGWFPFSKSNLEEIQRYRFDDIPRSTIKEEYITPSYIQGKKKSKRLY